MSLNIAHSIRRGVGVVRDVSEEIIVICRGNDLYVCIVLF